VATYPIPGHGQRAALHPSGTKLVVDLQVNLGILDLPSGRLTSPLCLGDRQDLTALNLWGAGLMKKVHSQLENKEIEDQVRKSFQQMGMDETAASKHFQDYLQETKKTLARIGTSEWLAEQAPIRGSEQPMSFSFSPDGSLFFCATSHGARVYAWEEMLGAEQQMPRPLFAVDGRSDPDESKRPGTAFGGYTYALVHDAEAHRLLFGGLGGTIEYLDLRSGLSGTLIDPPGRPGILHLAFTRDGSALLCNVRSSHFELQIWNYLALHSGLEAGQ
jgi:hypothetical protein